MEHSLSKELGLAEAIGLCVGTIIGGTIYAALGVVTVVTGGQPELAFLLAALVAALVGYSYAEISAETPDCGGSYSIVTSILGKRAGLIAAPLQLLAYTVAAAFYAWVFAEHLGVILDVDLRAVAIVVLALLTLVVVLGASETGRVTTFMAASKVAILLGIAVVALLVLEVSPPSMALRLDVIKGAGLVFLGFEGFEVASSASGEMKNPKRDARLAVFASLTLVTIVYLALAVALRSAGVPCGRETTALAYLAEKVGGSVGLAAVVAGSFLSTLSAALASLYASSRLLFAMARDGNAPSVFVKTWRRGSPWAAALAAGSLAVVLTVLGVTHSLLRAGSLSFMALFLMVSFSGLKALRRKWVPALAVVGLLMLAGFLVQ